MNGKGYPMASVTETRTPRNQVEAIRRSSHFDRKGQQSYKILPSSSKNNQGEAQGV